MGKCVSKHPSLLTIALSEKDLVAANQIWSKFAESAEYIPLKDERHNQLCAFDSVDSKRGASHNRSQNEYANDKQQQPQLQLQQEQQQQHQQECNDNVAAERWQRNENKSGQWTINEKLKRDQRNRQDCVDAASAVAADDESDIAAVLVAKSGASGCWHIDVDAVDIALHVANSRNDGHKVRQHHLEQHKQQHQQLQQQQKHACLPHLRLQQHGDDVADSNNNDSVNVANIKEDKNHKNIKHKKQQQQQEQQNHTKKNKKQHKVKRKLQLINCVVAHEPETEAEDGAERLNYYSDCYEQQQQQERHQQQQQQQQLKQSFHSPRNEEHIADVYKDESGQTESKKHAKKLGNATGMETKGTAMSFGFRKKLNTTPKKLKKLLEGDIGSKKKHQQQQQDKCNNFSDGGVTTDADGDTVDKAGTVIDTEMGSASQEGVEDDNGNAALVGKVHFEKVGAAAANNATSATQCSNQAIRTATANMEQAPTAGSPRPGAGNRFGYRGTNIVRPASTGLTPRHHSDMHDNMANNNNCGQTGGGEPKPLVSNLKRRSKSAHAGRTLTSADDDTTTAGNSSGAAPSPKINQPKSITFNLNQNSTIEYQRRQFFQQPAGGTSGRVAWPAYHAQPYTPQQQQLQQQSLHKNIINTGLHTNVIVRPTPRAPPASYSKFTLQTVSLPRPEFPVAISVNATTPTTPGSGYTPSPTMATVASCKGALAKELNAQQQLQQQQQHPLTAVAVASAAPPSHMDLKTAKQMANSTRRGFTGSREISADSGIASMDMALDSSTSSGGGGAGVRTASPKRSRSRPRNLQMVMNGRHKFEVRDLEDPLSSESSSLVEPLALPKLPTENQTAPLPLCGLVRSNTVLSRETYERNGGSNALSKQVDLDKSKPTATGAMVRNSSEESEGVDEEKLYLDRSTSEKSTKYHQFKDINTCSSKTSSPGSSIMLSWCNAGESLAVKDCSSLSISSSEDSNKLQEDKHNSQNKTVHLPLDLNDDDLSTINTDMQVSTISSITETLSNKPPLDSNVEAQQLHEDLSIATLSMSEPKPDRPQSLYNTLNESKFAEMALAGSTYLLDDETSPTDSLVSSTESEEAASKQKKHKINEELQEKDIDEISPELEVGSPISPGTPTHASHSLSLSDCGNLIDDEIADQPALLFNSEAQDALDSLAASRKEKTETPTLMETTSLRSLKSQSRARSVLQQAIELSLRTPLSLRKAVMERAESLDTLSPCESICSDDLMMDFDMNSSVDSIDRSGSIRSRSGSDLHKIDETELFSELERKGSDVMKELNTIMRIHTNRNTEKDNVIAHLPARATRLLNRSRLQQQCPLTNADSDSSKSPHSIRGRSAVTSRASTASNSTNASQQRGGQHHHHHHHHHHQQRELHSSSDDLMLYDKSFRNAMIQDVLQFKKQLLRLRRILQEDEDCLMRTETLNPFENDNGQLFASCGLDSKLLDDIDLASLTSSTTDDPIQELADLRRQVVYLQGQVEDRDRTIRLQRNRIENLEATKSAVVPALNNELAKECISMATQTERTRPLSIGAEGLSRSKPEYTSYTTHFPTVCGDATTIIQHQQQCPANQTRRHTIISTTLTNYHNQQLLHEPRRASIAWEKPTTPTTAAPATATAAAPTTPAIYKPVKITLIGEPLKQWPCNGSQHAAAAVVESKRSLANGNELCLNGNSLPLNGLTHQQQQQLNHQNHHSRQPPQPSSRYKSPHANGNFNPTVTIV